MVEDFSVQNEVTEGRRREKFLNRLNDSREHTWVSDRFRAELDWQKTRGNSKSGLH